LHVGELKWPLALVAKVTVPVGWVDPSTVAVHVLAWSTRTAPGEQVTAAVDDVLTTRVVELWLAGVVASPA
jgi:hypothetical protein